MNLNTIFRYVGIVFLINALFLLISAVVSILNNDQAVLPLLYSAIVTALFGVFPLIFVPPTRIITNNEGLVIVISSWLLSCIIGTLPYILWGGPFNFINAWFESVSGYTTTGSSILLDIESLPAGLIFWRATTHWLGGMGIIMFVLSIIPSLGLASMILYRVEMSPVAKENFRQNAKSTLRVILYVYVGLTALETISLLFCGMNLFDAIIHSFATIATGGFSSKNNSIAYFNNISIEIVVIIFMVLSGTHFGLLFSTIFTRDKNILKSTVFRYYLLVLLCGVLITTWNLYNHHYHEFWEALRYSAFQIVSIGTSTGFANANSAIWPSLSQMLLIFFALQCACAGSTSGGIKADRSVMFGKAVMKQLKLLRHPRAIFPVRIGDYTIKDDVLAMGILYICLYLVIVFIGSVLLTVLGIDMISAFSAVVATTGNVGPGLGTVGSMANYNHIPDLGKLILTSTMLLGRLEIYGILLFFHPSIWSTSVKRIL
jgi:trk system potassium uptake protein TrkH